jgi:integrase
MSKPYTKYIREQKGSLYYQRDWPAAIKRQFRKKVFKVPMDMKANAVNMPELLRKTAQVSEEFDLQVKAMTNTNPEVYSDKELDVLVTRYLRHINQERGAFSDDENFFHYAEQVIPGLEDAFDTGNYDTENMTIQQKVKIRAYHLLEKESTKPLYLSELWTEYVEASKLDISSRNGEREQRHWKNIFGEIGEQPLDNPAYVLDRIHKGLDAYVHRRQKAGAKVQSIKREYARTLSALRAGSKKYRLGWVIEPNLSGVKNDAVNEKKVLTPAEQIAAIKYCIANTEHPDSAACVVLMMQTGAMASEIGRLDWAETKLDLLAEIPQVGLGKDGKTKDRQRIAPIVFGKDYLMQHLESAIELCANTVDSNVSHRIKNLLKEATGNPALSAHCLRHTLKANSDVVSANPSHVAAIGGWAGKSISSHQMRYGREGLIRDEGFRAVRDTSVRMHQHIIEAISEEDSNVVPLVRS